MGTVRIVETSYVGDVGSNIEYEFSDASDFFAWDELRIERLNNAIKSYVGGLDGSEYDEPVTSEVKVKKKETKH